jgi:hypothetical protein
MRGRVTIEFDYEAPGQLRTFVDAVADEVRDATCVRVREFTVEQLQGDLVVARDGRELTDEAPGGE